MHRPSRTVVVVGVVVHVVFVVVVFLAAPNEVKKLGRLLDTSGGIEVPHCRRQGMQTEQQDSCDAWVPFCDEVDALFGRKSLQEEELVEAVL